MSEVEKAEAVVQKLEQTQRQLAHRGIELTEERQRVSFGAHTGDQKSRAKLDKINAEIATHASEVASIEAAISEGNDRLDEARRIAAAAADGAEAEQLADELKVFAGHGRKLDLALQALVEHGQALEGHGLVAGEPGQVGAHRQQEHVGAPLGHGGPDPLQSRRRHGYGSPAWGTSTPTVHSTASRATARLCSKKSGAAHSSRVVPSGPPSAQG